MRIPFHVLVRYGECYLYDNVYCALGDMENCIKDQRLELFTTRPLHAHG